MKRSTQNIIAMILAVIAFTMLMSLTSCTTKKVYKVLTINDRGLASEDRSLEMKSLQIGYQVGDTLYNDIVKTEIIVDDPKQ